MIKFEYRLPFTVAFNPEYVDHIIPVSMVEFLKEFNGDAILAYTDYFYKCYGFIIQFPGDDASLETLFRLRVG